MTTLNDFKETVRQQADIVRIIGDYIQLRKAGAQNFVGLCPFHGEKTPSFSVHATRQFFHCFGCGKSGDVFAFVQEREQISFPEAIRLIAEKVGIPLPKMQYSSEGEAEDGQRRGAVLGKRLAERLNVFPGSKLSLVSPAGSKFNASVGGYVPRIYQYEVTGVFETGMYEYDNSYIYVDLDQAKQFAGLGDAVTGIEARTRNRWEAGDVAKQLSDTLAYPYRVLDWQEVNSQLFQALKLEKLAMRIILLLIILVAAFNIVSTLTMVVKDKTREIGILKAMGLPARSVRRIFLAQGLVIGIVGTAIGVVIGVTAGIVINRGQLIPLDPTVYFIDHLPVTIQLGDVTWIAGASIIIAALATLYPAIQAARLFPVEAIRHE